MSFPGGPGGLRSIGWIALLIATLGAASPARAAEPPLFRLFLNDGSVVTCLGEYARLERDVVCSLPLDGDQTTELVTLRADRVDWTRTEEYTGALRAARYGEARGEHDFAELGAEVARLLNEVAQTTDNARRLGLALEARRRLSEWPAQHFNYRANDIQQILALVEDAISDFRAAAGAQQFDVALHAQVMPPPAVPLLAAPTPEEAMTTAVAVAERTESAGERVSLFEAIARTLAKIGERLPVAVRQRLQALVGERLAKERAVDEAYARMAAQVVARSRESAGRADVRGVERALSSVGSRDAELGRQRPDRVAAVLATVQADLDAARRLRLARDQWAVKAVAYRSYQQSVRLPLDELSLMSQGLDDIKQLAGPAAPVLARLTTRAAAAIRGLASVVPPTDLAAVHALIVSAAQLSAQAVAARQDAVASGAMDRAWQASSAAAGALMLLDRARQDLARALVPPGL
jgi:hypothetical protein